MLIPVRCYNCGSVLGNKWARYCSLLKSGKTTAEALDELKIKKMCCRMNILGHVNSIDAILEYDECLEVATRQEDSQVDYNDHVAVGNSEELMQNGGCSLDGNLKCHNNGCKHDLRPQYEMGASTRGSCSPTAEMG
jgi:DNA-directed RNA polymerase I, II, and III subunit RPABC5